MRVPVLASILGLLLCLSVPLRGQAGGGDSLRDSECRRAGEVLRTGDPPGDREWAEWRISACPSTGPADLARMWSSPPADSTEFARLVGMSSHFGDRRLYAAVRAYAMRADQPDIRRAAALALLHRWADPDGASLPYERLLAEADEPTRWRIPGVVVTHDDLTDGAEPLPPGLRADVVAVARQIAASDASHRLRFVAEYLERRLTPR